MRDERKTLCPLPTPVTQHPTPLAVVFIGRSQLTWVIDAVILAPLVKLLIAPQSQ